MAQAQFRHCAQCGAIFGKRRSQARFCSDACKAKFFNEEKRQIRHSLAERLAHDQGGLCFYCFEPPGDPVWNVRRSRWMPTSLQLEHVIPLSYRPYQSSRDNLVAACSVCNRIKGSQVFDSIEQARVYVERERQRLGYRQTRSGATPTDPPPKHSPTPREQILERKCKRCEQPFRPRHRNHIFCGCPTPTPAPNIVLDLPERICGHCDKSFKPIREKQDFCPGGKCRTAFWASLRLPRPDKVTVPDLRAILRPYLRAALGPGRFRIRH